MVKYTVSLSQTYRTGLLQITESQKEAEDFIKDYVNINFLLLPHQSFRVYKKLHHRSCADIEQNFVIDYYVESVETYGWLWTVKCSKEEHLFTFIVDVLNETKELTYLTELKEKINNNNFGLMNVNNYADYTDIELFNEEDVSPLLYDLRRELIRRRDQHEPN